ncbi:MAG: 4Fe-4S binding protein [Bacillota bacterium]
MIDLFDAFAELTGCPMEFRPVLRRIVPYEALPLLVAASRSWVDLEGLACRLAMGGTEAKALAGRFFDEGFLHMRGGEVRARDPYDLLGTLLSEGRLDDLQPGEKAMAKDYYLRLRMETWDGHIREGLIAGSSEVVALKESLARFHRHPHQGASVVSIPDKALSILQDAKLRVLAPCSCRLTFARCSGPLLTCILLGPGAEEALSRGLGRSISMDEAEGVLSVAHEASLVHLVLYAPGGPYGVCSCCACCCHDLQAFRLHGRGDWIIPSPYVAVSPSHDCDGCGVCAEVCAFGARRLVDGELICKEDECYGCGVCVNSCPLEAISLTERP